MITDEFVVEKPSFVEIKLTGDNIILYDYLLEQRFVLSPIAYEMFLEFDGIKSIRDEKYFSDMLQLAEDSFADEIEMSEILNVNQNLNISSLMLSEKQSKNFRINTLKGFSISKAFRKGMGLYRYKKGTEYICSAGTKNIFIDINGDVYPCNLFAKTCWYTKRPRWPLLVLLVNIEEISVVQYLVMHAQLHNGDWLRRGACDPSG